MENKYYIRAGCATTEVLGGSHEDACEKGRGRLLEILAAHLNPEDADYPTEIETVAQDGSEKVFTL